MKKTYPIVVLVTALATSCATLENSVLIGAGVGGAAGAGMGFAIHQKAGSTLIGTGIGALVGAGIGYLIHKDQEQRREEQRALAAGKYTDDKVPFLTAPQVERVWQPESIEGEKFIQGHFIYVIKKPSVWGK